MTSTLAALNQPIPLVTRRTLSASVIRTTTELAALRAEWTRLFHESRCASVFLSFPWLANWWQQFGAGSTMFVVTIQDQSQQLVALAPLYISRRSLGLHRLGFLGDNFVGSDYLDILVDPNLASDAVDCLSAHILAHRNEWDYIDLADTKDNSYASTMLREAFAKPDCVSRISSSSNCPFALLPATPAEYLASLGPKLRKHLGYYLRALQKVGTVEFVSVTHDAEISDAFEELLRLHTARLQKRQAESAFARDHVAAFHRAVVKDLAAESMASIHLLKLDGKTIAAVYVLRTNEVTFFYQSGIDPAYSRFSIGSLLIRFAIDEAIRSQCREFDFLRGDEAYKTQWTNGVRRMQSLRFFDSRPKSQVAQALNTLHQCASDCKALLLSGEATGIRGSIRRLLRERSGEPRSSKQEARSL